MVKTHKYNTRSNINNSSTTTPEENIYIITNGISRKKQLNKSKRKRLAHAISDVSHDSDNNSDDNSDSVGNSDSDDESESDNDEIASEMRDFIVDDSHSDSDDSDDDSDDDDDSSDSNHDDSNNDVSSNEDRDDKSMTKYQYAKFLNKIFPSNYTRDKINNLKRKRLLSPSSSSNNLNHIIFIDANMLNNNFGQEEQEEDVYSDRNEDHEEEFCPSPLKIRPPKKDKNTDQTDSDSDSDEDQDLDRDRDQYEETCHCPPRIRPPKKDTTSDDKKSKKEREQIERNFKEYKTIFNQASNAESKYFRTALTTIQQEDILQRLKTVKELTSVKKPYLIYLAELDIPDMYKACAINKFNQLSNMDEAMANGEYYKLKTWIDGFVKIPFNKYAKIPVHVSDGLEKCNQFITEAKHILDTCVFGLDSAKMQILQLIGLWIVNPESIGTSISLKGPMGVGKTTIIKDGISKILNRYFKLIPLGGASDIGHFEGHSYTYEGSTYGKIIDILIQSRQMNPIIYFDELDKVSDSPKGEEVIGLLTHLTDATQNACYHDKYFSEIEFDLSKILYIFSYNDDSKINPILRDRMYNIEIKGYTIEDKMSIARLHLLPKIRVNVNFTEDDIVFTDDIVKYIIQKYTESEEGVRNLKRCFEIIYTKLNLLKLLRNDNVEMYKLLNIEPTTALPLTLTNEIVDKLLYLKELSTAPPFGMYN